MKVSVDESFTKDTDRITNKKIRSRIAEIIEEVKKSDKISDIRNCKKLTGFKNAYRIRVGQYRIGFVFEDQTVDFSRFLHRSEVYDHFPD